MGPSLRAKWPRPFQMAVLKKLPILYLIQDNGWAISASADETRAMDAPAYAQGFPG
jgi:hypothetical protein